MDQLMAMRAFTRVVETGSFTRAADSLNMPIATLSKLVKSLETHLEIRLLHRTTRRVLIPLLPDFMRRYPDIRIDLGVADRPVDLIGGNVDCVIRGGPLDDSTLIARHIGNAEMVTCATPGYLKNHGVPAYPQELCNGHKLISYLSPVTGRAFPFRFRRHGEAMEINIPHYLGINESNAHLAAAVAGLGIVQTFEYSAKPYLQAGTLAPILGDWRPAAYPFHVVYPQNRHLTHRLKVFIAWLAEVFPAALKG